jgi:hypothetical protein
MGEPMELDDDDTLFQRVANVKFDQKWEILKPKLEELHVQNEQSLASIQEQMKARYGFLA